MGELFLVIVNGPPGAGKTTLGGRIAAQLGLPFISKDSVKDILFDTLGWRDREWSKKLGRASFEILFHFLESQLEAGQPSVVETAFTPAFHTARFLGLRELYGFEPIQIYCRASDEVLFERFNKRSETGERHPGHVDHLVTYDQFLDLLREERWEILKIGGSFLEVDTTDFESIDYEALEKAIDSAREA